MDVEPDLLDWLTALDGFEDGLVQAYTSTPAELDELLFEQGKLVLRVKRIGGPGDADNEFPVVSVQSYAPASADAPRTAWKLDTAVADKFFSVATGGPELVGSTVIEDPGKDSGPVELPYPNAAITVVESLYRFTSRR